MIPLITAIKRSKNKLVIFCSVLISAVSLLVSIAILDSEIQSKMLSLIPPAIAVMMTVTVAAVLRSDKECKKALVKLLGDGGYGSAELDSIILEMNYPRKAEYYDRGYRLSLFITESWLILISTNGSVIEKRDNLISVRKKLMTSQSKYAAVLKFPNRQLVCPCDRICEELIEMIKFHTKGANK